MRPLCSFSLRLCIADFFSFLSPPSNGHRSPTFTSFYIRPLLSNFAISIYRLSASPPFQMLLQDLPPSHLRPASSHLQRKLNSDLSCKMLKLLKTQHTEHRRQEKAFSRCFTLKKIKLLVPLYPLSSPPHPTPPTPRRKTGARGSSPAPTHPAHSPLFRRGFHPPSSLPPSLLRHPPPSFLSPPPASPWCWGR